MAFTIFLGHTAYRLLVTIHMFCVDSHTTHPSAVHSSTFVFVIRFVSLQFDSCYISCGLFQNMDPALYRLDIDINIVD